VRAAAREGGGACFLRRPSSELGCARRRRVVVVAFGGPGARAAQLTHCRRSLFNSLSKVLLGSVPQRVRARAVGASGCGAGRVSALCWVRDASGRHSAR